tara:strand:- start:293 stop:514 length:222 start_codon:yes stop_codon:yes gene_type:complete
MIKSLIDMHQVVKAREANKVILEHLKINFKEVESKSKNKYFQLYRSESQDSWDIIEELNRWRVQNFLDIILLD